MNTAGRLLEWQDDDGVTHHWAMPLALLQGDASEVRRELASLGLTISPHRISRDLLATYLQVFPVEDRALCVEKLGWHENLFVTPSQIFGHSSEKIVFQNSHAIESRLLTSVIGASPQSSKTSNDSFATCSMSLM